MIERIRYGGVSNPYNYSEFTCDTAADIADLPTNKDIGKYKNLDTCSIGSKATVISDRTMYILNGDNQWILLKDYKTTGGGSSILIDETLTESGQAADAKAVGDKIAEVKESAHTHSNKDVLDEITSNKITAWDGYSTDIQYLRDSAVGKKDIGFAEIFNDYTSNKATGLFSHAEGEQTAAKGDYTHAEGKGTVSTATCQHVQGLYNIEDTKNKYAFIIGNGTSDTARSNAFSVDWDGKIYVNNATEGVDVSALAITIAELQSQLSRKTIQFRHGKGMFTATASGTNITWQYGGQKAQGNNCTFDIKSDNGLITLECDTVESLTIKNDTTNKMNLSDLGGKIADVLSLESCPNITGDLSDLGGKIASSLNLTSCTNITGDLSDLGGKIANWLSLDNCTNITGDLSDLGGKITNWLSLKGCPNITGDLSDLGGKIASMLNLGYCSNITGVYSGTKYPKTFYMSKTAIASSDMDANLINFATSGVKSGTFTATGMKRTAASDDAVATLVANGWTVSGLTKES